MFAPPSAWRNFFKCAPPLTWNPGSAPGYCQCNVPVTVIDNVCQNLLLSILYARSCYLNTMYQKLLLTM
jgi:hypothetical protein